MLVVPYDHPVVVAVVDLNGDGVCPDGVAAHAAQAIAHSFTAPLWPDVGQVALTKLKHELENISIKVLDHSSIP